MNGLPLGSVFKPTLSIEDRDEDTCVIPVRKVAVFTNWIPPRRGIDGLDSDRDVVVDLSETLLVEHTVMEKLHELQEGSKQYQRRLDIVGLDSHYAFSEHPHAARRKDVAKQEVPR